MVLPERTGDGFFVLIVEDDAETAGALVDVIQRAGFSTMRARHGVEAFTFISPTKPPNVILLDLSMPKMDGWEFLEELREDDLLSGVPVIAMSANPRASIRGADEFLKKPLVAEELLQALRRHCR